MNLLKKHLIIWRGWEVILNCSNDRYIRGISTEENTEKTAEERTTVIITEYNDSFIVIRVVLLRIVN